MLMYRFRLIWGARLCFALMLGLPALAAEPGPKLVADDAEFHFGKAITGGAVEHTFVLRNLGDADLVIDRVKPACGCTTAQNFENVRIAPSESVELPVALSLKGRSGSQRKSITVHSNDPEQPQFKLWITGEAIQPIQIEPSMAALGRIKSGQQPTTTLQLAAATDRQFSVKSVTTSSNHFDAEVEEIVAGELYQVRVRVASALPTGDITETLTVHTTDPNVPNLTVPIRGHVADNFSIAPRELVLMPASPPATRYVMIGPGAIETFEVTRVEVPDQAITTTILKAGLRGYRVRLTGVPADESLDGEAVRIFTDADSHPVIEVPLRVVSTEPAAPAAATQE